MGRRTPKIFGVLSTPRIHVLLHFKKEISKIWSFSSEIFFQKISQNFQTIFKIFLNLFKIEKNYHFCIEFVQNHYIDLNFAKFSP